MSLGHLLFAIAMPGYIVIAVGFEERDLLHYLGRDYAEYRRAVPMLLPGLKHLAGGRTAGKSRGSG
jgi:protein-S-isoprenylcysteine O-methyltransferase Ste14